MKTFGERPQEESDVTTGQIAESRRYFVSQNGEEKGPFSLDLIEALVLSGHYPRNILLREEGSRDWEARLEQFALEPPHPPQAQTPSSEGIQGWKWIISLIIVALVAVVLAALGNSKSKRQPPRSASSHHATTTVPTTVSRPNGPATSRAQSTPVPASSDNILLKDDQGRTYRVSSSESRRLSILKSNLMQEAAALTALQEKVKFCGNDLDRAQIYLNRRSQASVDAYNRQVDRYNALNEEANQELIRLNQGIAGFNAELARVGTPVR